MTVDEFVARYFDHEPLPAQRAAIAKWLMFVNDAKAMMRGRQIGESLLFAAITEHADDLSEGRV